jgi:hypothetical protein
MRVSLLASVIAHIAILLGALVSWGSPRTHDWRPPSVEVDIVPPEEAPPVPEPQPQQEAKQEQPASAAPQPPAPQPPPSAPPQQQAQQPSQPWPQPESSERGQQTAAPAAPNPTGRRDLPPVAPPKPLSEGEQPEQPQNNEQSQSKLALDAKTDPAQEQAETAARLAELINVLPDGTIARSTAPKSKELTFEEMAELKARISKCWVPPSATGAERPLVIIRVKFSPDGAVAGEPELIQAPPVASGPLVMRNAISAVQRCGPYSFLPREKYKDWRVLDLAFTPSGIS